MTRETAIATALDHFDSGRFREDLARRIAIPTESQNPARAADLRHYLDGEMTTALAALGLHDPDRSSTRPRRARSCWPSGSRTRRSRPCSATATAT